MSKEYLKVEGYDNLVRDNNSHAIINTDKSAYQRAVARAKAAAKERDEIRSNAREINNLKCEMHEIKDMLKKVLEKNGN
jgi:broad specificity phosphatase PhoE